jgi:hypothetical protein
MRKIKFIIAALASTCTIILSLSFSSEKSKSTAFFLTTYYFDTTTAMGLHYSIYGGNLQASEITDISNWLPGNLTFSNGNNLAAIRFPEEAFNKDGSGDGMITLQEAIQALWNYYVANGKSDLPGDGESFSAFIPGSGSGSVDITVRRRQ